MVHRSTKLLQQAIRDTNLLDLLKPACKTIESSRQELRWIQKELPRKQWLDACVKRSKLVPLQYILGSQPFGDLNIKCRDNVLIPRWETEEWTHKLIKLIKQFHNLKILDVCTGTGCIPLAIANSMPKAKLKGIDISNDALRLAEENKNDLELSNIVFDKGDVFDKDVVIGQNFDLITANPPYITQESFDSKDTEDSVKLYEPRLALIGDVEFYKALIDNIVLPSNAQAFVFELGTEKQLFYTKELLENEWETEALNDSSGNLRCVYGWKKNSRMQVLNGLNK